MPQTIGTVFASKRVQVNDVTLIMGIWDTAGSEKYDAMTRTYYRGAKAAIVCYDITKSSTFQRARHWVRELRSIEENCKVYLCGTKKDLCDQGVAPDDPDMLGAVESRAVRRNYRGFRVQSGKYAEGRGSNCSKQKNRERGKVLLRDLTKSQYWCSLYSFMLIFIPNNLSQIL
ncbi:PREDICTED: ras-related protein Rab-24-like isoform X3 [Wasmannia auropunctata]|uniref:ras-related protein Rab-24-like isoform X3 n=1 Tax=Wasmannia auropunctata TaxID=64793 RepID=UPI0005EE79E9|nr:PREDICTED: ras-related protein Rab-24-like isoform X3 [Wasmannia auropunctata]XP_011690555.1 PREDICTED: ras-related protein Rab-24-like isoform X3 [Wasmannia auropunctata]XP_011690557.1 PREDICTED: ras-related protein Rab-24-like isoform X3 [Wasmannia auropunctata]